jgi:hypothetical protein
MLPSLPRQPGKNQHDTTATLRSGKKSASPQSPPLRTVRACFHAYGSSMVKRTSTARGTPPWSGGHLHVTPGGPATDMPSVVTAAPATTVTVAPTFLRRCLRWLTTVSRAATPEGSQPACAWGDTNPYPAHYRPAFACSLDPLPAALSGHLTISLAGQHPAGQRAYHVPQVKLTGGLGRVSPPVVRHLRRESSEPPDLTTCLLAQA